MKESVYSGEKQRARNKVMGLSTSERVKVRASKGIVLGYCNMYSVSSLSWRVSLRDFRLVYTYRGEGLRRRINRWIIVFLFCSSMLIKVGVFYFVLSSFLLIVLFLTCFFSLFLFFNRFCSSSQM